jgi:hypothetical protein
LILVGYAGWMSAARPHRPARQATAVSLPFRWPDLGHRFAVFVLVVPCAFMSAQWLALGIQALARRGGMGDADAIALALFLQPGLWGVVMAMQMTRATAARMVAPLVVVAMLGTLLWGAS